MVSVSYMRLLRREFGISARELANAAGVSQQYVSDIELGKYNGLYDYRKNGEVMMQEAFASVIEQRVKQMQRLTEKFMDNRHRLLDFVTEEDYEL